jgi:glycine/D-amino acid oxidase-like deaminating enzyme
VFAPWELSEGWIVSVLSRRKFLVAAGVGLAAGATGLVVDRRSGVERDGTRTLSLWTLEAPPIARSPRLAGDLDVDAAIVGGGYTGLACGYYLKKLRPKWSVAVLESHRLGSGASSRNSGMALLHYPAIGENQMTRRAFERWRQFLEDERIDCDFQKDRVLYLYPSASAAESARSKVKPTERWLSAEELREQIGTTFYAGATSPGESFAIHPGKLVAGHVSAARRVDVDLYEYSPVMEVVRGKTVELVTPTGTVRSRHAVIATNAYTPRLGLFRATVFPVHHYTFATRELGPEELRRYRLAHWRMRYEQRFLPVSTSVTPSGRFIVRVLLGYAAFNSCEWGDICAARRLARTTIARRYPWTVDTELEYGWHGVTGHTLDWRIVAGPIADGNIHASVAYNGTGVVPAHYNGYLTAARIAGEPEADFALLQGTSGHVPLPEPLRSLGFKPLMRLLRAS